MNDITKVSSAIEAACGLAKPVVETGCKLIENLLGEPCKVAGNMLADQVYSWQWGNRIRIANKAQVIMEKNGIAAKVLPPGFLIPLLREAGDIEEPTLQDMWANLLVSGVKDKKHQHPSYITTLSQFTVLDARLLKSVYCSNVNHGETSHKHSMNLHQAFEELKEEIESVLMGFENLRRLGVLKEATYIKNPDENLFWSPLAQALAADMYITITLYGEHFYRACTGDVLSEHGSPNRQS